MTLTRLLQHWATRLFAPDRLLLGKYDSFRELLRHDKRSLELISDLEDILHSGRLVDSAAVVRLAGALSWSVGSLIRSLTAMHPGAYRELDQRYSDLAGVLSAALPIFNNNCDPPYSLSLVEAAGQPELAGGKAHALGRMLREMDLPLPRGFVITTRAFNLFLAHNDLRHRLDELLAEVRFDDRGKRLQELSGEMTLMIRQAEMPQVLKDDIGRRLIELQRLNCSGPWAIRSSAVFEDGGEKKSFAGQYASILQVDDKDIPAAYKDIISSKYSAHAIAYRIRCGLADQEAPMAVIAMEMIESRHSGVLYTKDRTHDAATADCLAIFAVAGSCHRLVDGSAEPEVYRFIREMDRLEPTLAMSVTGLASLAPASAARLADWGMHLEQLFGCPQDIEWCEDVSGALHILQSRPLQMALDDNPVASERRKVSGPDRPILLSGGVTASSGVGSGRVFILHNEAQLADVPDDAVLVSATLPPVLAGIIERLQAVVAEGGSRASHFASVAREAGLPVLTGIHGAARKLTPGSTVTVDAWRNAVYAGAAGREGREKCADIARETPFMTRLAALMELVSPLHLLDPAAPEFSPRHCRSMHDLVRFAHEKGMAEMFSLVGPSGREMNRARQLVGHLPLTMHILDLGGGLAPESLEQRVIGPDLIVSPLMRAFWEGLCDPQTVWPKGLACLDAEQADRHSGGIIGLKSAAFGSYAVVAREYLHLVLRFGYHFAVLDTLGGEDPEANYIAFRFKGGGGSYENRLLRIKLIEAILAWAGFTVKTKGDLLNARFERRPVAEITSRLTILGVVQGRCRLLDMSLAGSGQVEEMTESLKAKLQRLVDTSAEKRD